MRTRRTGLVGASLLLLVMATCVVGCGGSGSSGFDAVSSVSQAIAQAIDANECVAFEEQTFCASGIRAETDEFAGATVTIKAPDAPLPCSAGTPGLACAASLDFTTDGFRVVNSLLAAVAETEDGPWQLVPLHATDDVLGPHRVTISVPAEPDATTPRPFIAAVLVYAGVPPATVPDTGETLADFQVDLVYVSRRLEIVVPRLPLEQRALATDAPETDG